MSNENETIVLSGTMHTPDISDAEREAALKAGAMDSLADEIQEGIDYLRDAPTMVRRLTKQEWELIVFALRSAAE